MLSMNGAPRIAPQADLHLLAPRPKNRDDRNGCFGSVVPTAANTLPTAPSEICRRLPSHSIPFIEEMAPGQGDDHRSHKHADIQENGHRRPLTRAAVFRLEVSG